MKTLVIVESKTKGAKIQGYLGTGYKVRACFGHIRDLPAKKEDVPAKYQVESWARLGIDVVGGFQPLYIVPTEKKKLVAELRKLAGEADEVLLATDGDREGEAIAWHLIRALGLKKNFQRMVFHEITKEAIQKAVQNTRQLDYNLVGAQESRRMIDRLAGYGVSPALWQSIGPGLSAGRVQSAALASLARRELARMNHVAADYWRIAARIVPGETGGEPFTASVVSIKGQPLAGPKDYSSDGQLKADSPALVITAEQAEQIVNFLKERGVKVKAREVLPYSTKPPPPFTTSTLQQAASKALKMGPKKTMEVAQKLYESGKITYMRTDSPALSDEATEAARAVAAGLFGPASVPSSPRVFKAKGNAQEAHEAIRPTGKVFTPPDQAGLEGDELALYELVFHRTVASQMIDLQGSKTVLSLACGAVGLQSSGRVVVEPGFTRLYADDDKKDEQELPNVQEGEALAALDAKCETKKTPAPGRFTEATLIKALESAGVGRPATYASIIEVLKARQYTALAGGQMHVTWLGLLVAAYLQDQFANLVDLAFTVKMEEDLDRIAAGEMKREDYLTGFWTNGLARTIAAAKHQPPTLALSKFPGVAVTTRHEQVVMVRDGHAVPLGLDIVPDSLTPELIGRILNGETVKPRERGAALSGKPKTRKSTAGKKTKSSQD
ncbi:type I DNA topoisomerase [Deinococcus cavernae]|uniref:DNA topoisomerase 1 n=1 Tax=Deinococcus cavernae TaxID=2320857 RepID=A0A418VEU0_9DEIO|nr:type I DNA topoisomerase [Deinococcus cavernae]RJF74628.1 type I DNA topoisomerase [Deinococcus cavernae]